MKKLLFFLFLTAFCSTSSFAQTSAIFCGVDFSLVKVRGAGESDAAFVQAFQGINELFISQGEKYDIAKYMRQTIARKEPGVALKAMKSAFGAAAIDSHILLYEDPGYDCRDQIDAQVASYELPQSEGTAIVVIANMLDKTNDRGSFYFVSFDIASREVISCTLAKGKPGGFGLRNYWANSLRLAMKNYYKGK
ncbi:hypothetical protein [uncultured Alistipes sp.]|uniref:hypothetical protein n=1 Tax=uncultured Alistipes sp. TaxID=538949 RepID=UPI0025D4E6F2|nr:hypothetical protein [uncultured Alistipes sp.]